MNSFTYADYYMPTNNEVTQLEYLKALERDILLEDLKISNKIRKISFLYPLVLNPSIAVQKFDTSKLTGMEKYIIYKLVELLKIEHPKSITLTSAFLTLLTVDKIVSYKYFVESYKGIHPNTYNLNIAFYEWFMYLNLYKEDIVTNILKISRHDFKIWYFELNQFEKYKLSLTPNKGLIS